MCMLFALFSIHSAICKMLAFLHAQLPCCCCTDGKLCTAIVSGSFFSFISLRNHDWIISCRFIFFFAGSGHHFDRLGFLSRRRVAARFMLCVDMRCTWWRLSQKLIIIEWQCRKPASDNNALGLFNLEWFSLFCFFSSPSPWLLFFFDVQRWIQTPKATAEQVAFWKTKSVSFVLKEK